MADGGPAVRTLGAAFRAPRPRPQPSSAALNLITLLLLVSWRMFPFPFSFLTPHFHLMEGRQNYYIPYIFVREIDTLTVHDFTKKDLVPLEILVLIYI